MIYDVVNPSDPYTLVADELIVAAFAVTLVGRGQYALNDVTGEEAVPLFLFGGAEEWFKAQGVPSLNEWLESKENLEKVVPCLRSFLIGRAEDRQTMDKVLAVISNPKERIDALAVYHDQRRSSMNDIGGRANEIADALEKRIQSK